MAHRGGQAVEQLIEGLQGFQQDPALLGRWRAGFGQLGQGVEIGLLQATPRWKLISRRLPMVTRYARGSCSSPSTSGLRTSRRKASWLRSAASHSLPSRRRNQACSQPLWSQ